MAIDEVIFDTFRNQVSPTGSINGTGNILDAAGEREAYIGRVEAPHWKSGTKTITSVDVVFSSKVNGTGTTTVRCSLRGVDVSSGSPVRDNGTIDQSGTLDITAITALTAVTTFTLDTGRTVSRGDELAVVIDFSAFGSGASVVMRTWGNLNTYLYPGIASYIGVPAWTPRGGKPSLRLVCDDGSYLYLGEMFALNQGNITSGDFGSTTSGNTMASMGDERGNLWVPKQAWDITRITLPIRATTASTTGELCIYRDITLLETAHVVNSNRLGALTALSMYEYALVTPVRVEAGENIRITFRPTTADTWRVAVSDVASNQDRLNFFLHDGIDPMIESAVQFTQRVDQGAWNEPSGSDKAFTHMAVRGYKVAQPRGGMSQMVVGSNRF